MNRRDAETQRKLGREEEKMRIGEDQPSPRLRRTKDEKRR